MLCIGSRTIASTFVNVKDNVVRPNNIKGVMNKIMLTDTWRAPKWTYQLLMVVWIMPIVRICKKNRIGYKVWICTSHGIYCLKLRKLALMPWSWLAKQVNTGLPWDSSWVKRRITYWLIWIKITVLVESLSQKNTDALVQYFDASNLGYTFRSQDHWVPIFKSTSYQYPHQGNTQTPAYKMTPKTKVFQVTLKAKTLKGTSPHFVLQSNVTRVKVMVMLLSYVQTQSELVSMNYM